MDEETSCVRDANVDAPFPTLMSRPADFRAEKSVGLRWRRSPGGELGYFSRRAFLQGVGVAPAFHVDSVTIDVLAFERVAAAPLPAGFKKGSELAHLPITARLSLHGPTVTGGC